MSIEIRKALKKDTKALRELARASKQHWGYSNEYMRIWNTDKTITPNFVEKAPVCCAVSDGEIVAFYAFAVEGDPRELKHFWVSPAYINKGIGRRLFTHATEYLQSQRVKALLVSAEPHAEGFYLRMGGERVGTKSNTKLNQKFPVVRFELELATG